MIRVLVFLSLLGATNSTKPFQFTTATAAYSMEEWINGGQALYSNEVEQAFAESAGVFTALLRSPPTR